MNRFFWCAAIALVLAGCDPNAKANANDRLAFAKDRLSKEYESCSATAECAGELRCFQGVCRRTEASVVGDYHAAVGVRAMRAGNVPKAIQAYTAAVNRYRADKVAMPLEVLCGKGEALAMSADNREHAEEAARTLHECLRSAPVGSAVRDKALVILAKLGRKGLDPELLAREENLTEYLTKKPAKPPSSSVKVKATGDVKTRADSYEEFLEHLQSEDVRAELIPCWESNWKENKKKTLTTTVELKYYFYEGYTPAEDRDKLVLRSDEPAAGSPERCVFDAIGPIADEFSKERRGDGRWGGDITITLE